MIDSMINFMTGVNVMLSVILATLVLLWACIRMWFSIYYKIKYRHGKRRSVQNTQGSYPSYIQRGSDLDEAE